MKSIVFFPDLDEGHIYPLMGFAATLQSRGFKVTFIGIPDLKPLIENFNFEFYLIFEDIYPKGFIKSYKEIQKNNVKHFNRIIPRPHLSSIVSGCLDKALSVLEPDLIIINYPLQIEALLISCRYRLKTIFFTTWLRRLDAAPSIVCEAVFYNLPVSQQILIRDFIGQKYNNIGEAINDLVHVPEIIPCPKKFDCFLPEYLENVKHIEPSIRIGSAVKSSSNEFNAPPGKKLIYISLGSQTPLYKDWSKAFFQYCIDTIASHTFQDWHLVISIGSEFRPEDFSYNEEIATLSNWVNQIDVLKNADLAIIHGGLGTIKECIYYKVPMVVFPMAHDQFDNAKRVQISNLGVAYDHRNMEKIDFENVLINVLSSQAIQESLLSMSEHFRDLETLQPGVSYIEQMLLD